MSRKNHSWGPRKPFPPYKTERWCLNCPIVKVTRSEIDSRGRETFWHEYFRGLDQIPGKKTPACEAVAAEEEIAA